MKLTAKLAALALVLISLTGCPPPGQQGAEGAGEDGGGLGMFGSILPLILIFVVFYFLLIRPQQRTQKQHREMLQNVHRGDDIVTNGGLVGRVIKVGRDDSMLVEIAPGVRVRVMRNMISEVVRRPEPAWDEDEDEEDEEEYEEEYEEAEAEAEPEEEEKERQEQEQRPTVEKR
jgi:preprotein translocase subunit YajC